MCNDIFSDNWDYNIIPKLSILSCIYLSMTCKNYRKKLPNILKLIFLNNSKYINFVVKNNINILNTIKKSDFKLKTVDSVLFPSSKSYRNISFPKYPSYEYTIINTQILFQLMNISTDSKTKNKYITKQFICYLNNAYKLYSKTLYNSCCYRTFITPFIKQTKWEKFNISFHHILKNCFILCNKNHIDIGDVEYDFLIVESWFIDNVYNQIYTLGSLMHINDNIDILNGRLYITIMIYRYLIYIFSRNNISRLFYTDTFLQISLMKMQQIVHIITYENINDILRIELESTLELYSDIVS